MDQLENCKQDLTELETFLEQSKRPYVRSVLELSIENLKKKITSLSPKVEDKKEEKKTTIFYKQISNYSYAQDSTTMTIYVRLPGIGKIPRDNIKVEYTTSSVLLIITGYNDKNHKLFLSNLAKPILTNSTFKVRNNRVELILKKDGTDHWDSLKAKKSTITPPKVEKEKDEDPMGGLMNMMKKMYEEGDDQTKRMIAESWQKSREEQMKK
ncbi:calcyclin-binding protein [Anaeramoeba flamelloides]|uniref:Calcyclin-binding protein n=1 Tax=Anaeramoeba flamelloides TaxID=1746091 RepID=A0AAV7ZGJ4_9EUKA|nr:calcyclin-binding protein [Anaeramoeba flamelloides]